MSNDLERSILAFIVAAKTEGICQPTTDVSSLIAASPGLVDVIGFANSEPVPPKDKLGNIFQYVVAALGEAHLPISFTSNLNAKLARRNDTFELCKFFIAVIYLLRVHKPDFFGKCGVALSEPLQRHLATVIVSLDERQFDAENDWTTVLKPSRMIMQTPARVLSSRSLRQNQAVPPAAPQRTPVSQMYTPPSVLRVRSSPIHTALSTPTALDVSEIGRLRSEVKKLKSQLAIATDEVEFLTSEIEKVKDGSGKSPPVVSSRSRENESNQRTLEECEACILNLLQEKSDAQAKVENLRSELEAARAKIAEANAEKAQIGDDYSDLVKEHNSLTASFEKIQANCEQLKLYCATLKDDLQAEKSQNTFLLSKIADAETQITILTRESKDTADEFEYYRRNQISETRKLQLSLEEATRDLEAATKAREDAVTEAATARRLASSAQASLADKKTAHAEAISRVETLELQLERLQAFAVEQGAQIRQEITQREAAAKLAAEQGEKLETVQLERDALVGELEVVKQESEHLKSRNEVLEADREMRKADTDQLQDDLDKLRHKFDLEQAKKENARQYAHFISRFSTHVTATECYQSFFPDEEDPLLMKRVISSRFQGHRHTQLFLADDQQSLAARSFKEAGERPSIIRNSS